MIQRTRWPAAILLVILTAGAVRANVPPVVYNDDPNYQRARIASRVAPWLLGASLLLSVVWVVRARPGSERVAARAFGALMLSCGMLTCLSPPTLFPDEGLGGGGVASYWMGGPRGQPRRATPDERAVVGMGVTICLATAGLVLTRRARRRSAEARESIGKASESDPPR